MIISSKISDAITGKRHRCFLSDAIKSVLLNVVIDDNENVSVDVTNHAIEKPASNSGSMDITDSTWQKPLQMRLNCVLTDDISDIITGWSAMSLTSIEDRKKILKSWMDNKTILTYYSWDTDYENILIEDVNYRRSAETGLGVGVELSLKQVNIAESQIAGLTFGSNDKGKTPTKTDTKKVREKTNLKVVADQLQGLIDGL
jgi:hypothetical protein